MENVTKPSRRILAVFLDYSVLDHLQRIDAGSYAGRNEAALRLIRADAENLDVNIIVSEITPVEMLHGLEKLGTDAEKRAFVTKKDTEKLAISKRMNARVLGYPCSKLGDTYSRLDLSFRLAGPESDDANSLENKLLSISGISEGDARQLVSCAFPFDAESCQTVNKPDWFLAEDQKLIAALSKEILSGSLPELAHLHVGASRDFVSAMSAEV